MYIISHEHTIAAGFVPRDAEYKEFDWGVVCNFSIRADQIPQPGEQKPKAQWMRVVAYGAHARYARLILKGDSVIAAGMLISRNYTAKDGTEKTVKELRCEYVNIMARLPEEPDAAAGSNDFTELTEAGEDVPF